MKALQFLKEQKRRHQNMADSMKVVYFDDELDEAINELEQLQDKLNKSQAYIKDLEEQLRNKQENGWMNK